jgi:hypothetical protein
MLAEPARMNRRRYTNDDWIYLLDLDDEPTTNTFRKDRREPPPRAVTERLTEEELRNP